MATKKKIKKSNGKAKSSKIKKSLPKSKVIKSAKKNAAKKNIKTKSGAVKKATKKFAKVAPKKNAKKIKIKLTKNSKPKAAKKPQIKKIVKVEKKLKKPFQKTSQKNSADKKNLKLEKLSYQKPTNPSISSTGGSSAKLNKSSIIEKKIANQFGKYAIEHDNSNVREELKIGLSQPNQLLIKKPGVILIPSFPQAIERNENKNKKSVDNQKKSSQIAEPKPKNKKMNSAAMKKITTKVQYDKNGKAVLPQGYKPSDNEEYMNPLQLEYFRKKLDSWKKELLSESNETIEHLQGENWNEPDPSDQATIVEQTGLELRTRDRYRKLINKIDTALRRIEEGEYGYCEVTGDPIGIKRLEARPIATMTLAAQEQHELEEKLAYED